MQAEQLSAEDVLAVSKVPRQTEIPTGTVSPSNRRPRVLACSPSGSVADITSGAPQPKLGSLTDHIHLAGTSPMVRRHENWRMAHCTSRGSYVKIVCLDTRNRDCLRFAYPIIGPG